MKRNRPSAPHACLFLLLTVFCVAGCDVNTQSASTSVPGSQLKYTTILDPSPTVRVAGSPFEVTTNNCGSPVSTMETFSRAREFNFSVELELSQSLIGEIGGGISQVAEAKLGAEIGSALGIHVGTSDKVETQRQIETPKNSITTLSLQWEEIWSTGRISVIRPDGTLVGETPFFALTTMRLTQMRVITQNCEEVALAETGAPTAQAVQVEPREAPTNSPVPPLSESTNTVVPPTLPPPTRIRPTAIPPTAIPPTAIPPAAVPPTAVPPTAVPPTAIPPTAEIQQAPWKQLYMQTNPQQFSLVLTLNGQFQVTNDRVNIHLSSANFFSNRIPNSPKLHEQIDSLEIRLGHYTGNGVEWSTIRDNQLPISIGRLINIDEGFQLDNLDFAIPIPNKEYLADKWLIAVVTVDEVGTTYTHSSKSIFAQ